MKFTFKITLSKPDILWNVNVQISTVCNCWKDFLWYFTTLETYRENQIDENYNKLLFGELSSGWYYYINCVSAPGSHKLPHTGRQMGVGISGLHLNDLLTGKKKTIWLRLTSMNIHSNCHTYLPIILINFSWAKSHNFFKMEKSKFTLLFNICWNWLIYST